MSAPAPDPQFYLSHSGYVRRLARALVFDAHAAEDVEQETWLAALGRAPDDPRAARSWLRSIVRNFAAKARRASHGTEHYADRRAVRPTWASVRYSIGMETPETLPSHDAVQATVVGDMLDVRIDPARLPTPDGMFVADHCLVVRSREMFAFQFTLCRDPVELVPVSVLSVRMRRTHAHAFRSTLTDAFRSALDAMGDVDNRELASGATPPDIDCVIADYAMCRALADAATIRFYRFDVQPEKGAVRVTPVVQIETTVGVMRRIVLEVDELLEGDKS